MKSSKEIEETIESIKKVWYKVPELRLCQLLSNVARSNGWKTNDLFYLEDSELRESLEKYMKSL